MPRHSSGEAIARSSFSVGAIVKGTGLTFLIVLISAALLGLAVSLTEWEGFSRGLDGFTYVSIGLGGMFAAKQSKNLGWLHGGIVGLVYHVLSTFFFQADFTWIQIKEAPWLVASLWSFVAGGIGGVFGVNS